MAMIALAMGSASLCTGTLVPSVTKGVHTPHIGIRHFDSLENLRATKYPWALNLSFVKEARRTEKERSFAVCARGVYCTATCKGAARGGAEGAQAPPLAIRILIFISWFFTNIVL